MEATVYRTPEKVDISTNPGISSDIDAILAKGQYALIIDMTETVYISSVGLRTLISADKECRKNDGKMVIRNVGEMVRKVFEVTGLQNVLNIEG